MSPKNVDGETKMSSLYTYLVLARAASAVWDYLDRKISSANPSNWDKPSKKPTKRKKSQQRSSNQSKLKSGSDQFPIIDNLDTGILGIMPQQLLEDKARLACYLKVALTKDGIPTELKVYLYNCIPHYLLTTDVGIAIYQDILNKVQNQRLALSGYLKEYRRVTHPSKRKLIDLINELIILGYQDQNLQQQKHQQIRSALIELNISLKHYNESKSNYLKSKAILNLEENFGSGFVIEESGYLVTNHHVIKAAKEIKIRVDQNLYPARAIISDPEIDLAVLKIDVMLPAMGFHQSPIKLSQSVIALGFPNPREYGLSISVTEGSINSLSGYQDKVSHYQISTLVDRGNSGGPLIDEKSGGLVGVIVQQHKQNVKCSYAIKAETLLSFLAKYPALYNSLKYCNYRGLRRETIVEEACKSVVQVLTFF